MHVKHQTSVPPDGNHACGWPRHSRRIVSAGLVPTDPEMPAGIESGTVAADLVPADPEIPAIIESGTVAAGRVPADPEIPTVIESNTRSGRPGAGRP